LRLLLLLIFISIVVLGALHYSAHRPAYVVLHKGQPMPRHYIEAWSFGNVTIVEVKPSTTTVTVAPWS
jgi:hypothetical protein